MEFKKEIIELRKQNNLSQNKLAQKLNVSKQTISKWENGQAKPKMENLKNISKVFNVNIDMLLKENIDIKEDNLKYNKEEKGRIKMENKNISKSKIKGNLKVIIIISILIIFIIGIIYGINTHIKRNEARELVNTTLDNMNNIKNEIIKTEGNLNINNVIENSTTNNKEQAINATEDLNTYMEGVKKIQM